MRILILGNNYSAKEFYEFFEKDKDNIVFSTIKDSKTYVDFLDSEDIKEFSKANEINLVLITDDEYIGLSLQEELSELNISTFAPTWEANIIASYKSEAKKFIYKNKIQTPRFFIAEKPQQAIDYIEGINTPQAIKPDNRNFQECTQFAETIRQGQTIINKLFASGNKKIVIEDYIEGKSFTIWTITEGYSAKIIGTCATYLDNVAYFEPDFVTSEIKEMLFQNAIMPTIQALSAEGEEYVGILGFNFVMTYDNTPYLIGYKNFFDDLSVEFFTKGYNLNWADVFDSCIIGDIFLKYNFTPNDSYMLTLRQNEKIEFISANTITNLERYLKELNYDTKEYEEAKKIWKY